MAVVSLKNHRDILQSSLSLSLDWDMDANVSLLLNNRWPNQYLLDSSEDGEARGYALRAGLREPIAGHHINVSRPGAPNRRSLTRQTTARVGVEEAGWKADGPIVRGARFKDGKDPRKPAPPIVETVPVSTRGFEAGTYGYALGFGVGRRPTTTTGFTYFTLANNQRPLIPIPESFPIGAETLIIYMTRKGGGPASAAKQRAIPIANLRGRTEIPLAGPWRNHGKPPSANLTGLGVPSQPVVGRDVRIKETPGFHLRAGTWRMFLQLKNNRGTTILSKASEEIYVKPDTGTYTDENGNQVTGELLHKLNAGIWCRPPRIVGYTHRRKHIPNVKFTYWASYEPPTGGLIWYRAYLKRSRFGTAMYFGDNSTGPTLHGYPPEEEPKGLAVGLVSEESPAENTTGIEAPDPTAVPDTPVIGGQETPPAGTYLVTIHGETESGVLTQESEPTSVTITSSQTFRVSPDKTVNLLRNAEFSQLDATGKPEDWTPVNTGANQPGSYSVADGVLTLDTISTTTLPRMDSAKVPVRQDQTLTVSGALSVTRRSIGVARVVLRQLDDNNTLLVSTVVSLVDSLGTATFEQQFGPGGTAYNTNTTQVQLSVQMSLGADTSANLTLQARDLELIPYASDVRKVEFAAEGSGEMDDMNPPAVTPVSESSFIAYGPAPVPLGAELPEEEPPYFVEGFESGDWSAGWTVVGGGAAHAVEAAAAMHGAYGLRVQDSSVTGAGTHSRYRDVPNSGSSLANRFLLRVQQRHLYGYVAFGYVNDSAWGILATWRLYSNGVLAVLYWDGKTYQEANVTNVSEGDTADLEIIVSGAGTREGAVSAAVGKNGYPRKPVVSVGGLDLSGRSANRVYAGTTNASDNRARYNFHFDQIVATEKGDVANREQPSTPTGFTPPPTDRPARTYTVWSAGASYVIGDLRVPITRNGHYYSATTAGTAGPNEPVFPTDSGQTVHDNAGLTVVTRSTAHGLGAAVLKPSGTSTDAEWYEATAITGTGTTAATAPTYPTTEGATVLDGEVTFTTRKTVVWQEAGTVYRTFGEDGEIIGQIYTAILGDGLFKYEFLDRPIAIKPGMDYTFGTFMRWVVFGDGTSYLRAYLGGEDIEDKLAFEMSMTGARGWLEIDDYATFSVPNAIEGEPFYAWVRFELELENGIYIFQEPLNAQGLHTTFAARDSKRGYGCATTGEISTVLPSMPPGYELTLQGGSFWSEFGARPATDENAATPGTVTTHYSTSSDGVVFSAETTDPTLVAEAEYLKERTVLTGDGRYRPVIPSGGMFLRTWMPLPVLLRADGSHFPGVAYVDERIYATTYPDTEVDRVGGHHQTVEISEDITRLYKIKIGVSTERAMQEIDALALRDELLIELPLAGARVPGILYRVRLREQTEFSPGSFIRIRGEERNMYGVAEVGEAEVLEASPLQGIR